VSRAGASASSFAYGMLQNRGMLGGVFQPPYIFTESLDQDTELRFFDNCPAYQAQKDSPQVCTYSTPCSDMLVSASDRW